METTALPRGCLLLPLGMRTIRDHVVREEDIRAVDTAGYGRSCFVWLATEPRWHAVPLPAGEVIRRMKDAAA